ncbi:MAG TPA: M56 family metallopeptidase [Streptosporangiaceae bacterium]|jgi:Zn-dependent protease with chaperone function
MKPALLVFAYALAVAWYVPALLTRLTARGISARLGLAAWLTAMASVLASLLVALQFLLRAAVTGWSSLAGAVCRSVTGETCSPVVYRSAIFEFSLGVAATAAVLAAAALAWRYGRGVQRAQRVARAHAEAARITGRRLPGTGPAVVLDVPQPAAYCVPGRPATIVLTSGALAVLDPAQLTAVLAHERAHLAGRHHLLVALTRGLAASYPAVPLFTRAPAEVARLAEMCADDAAARRISRRALVTALLAMGTGMAVPVAALAATGGAVTARVQRLMEPPRRGCLAGYEVALTSLILGLALATALAGPLAAA